MIKRTNVTPIARIPDRSQWAAEDYLWSVSGDWTDVHGLLDNPRGWIRGQKAGWHDGHQVKIPAKLGITLFLTYPSTPIDTDSQVEVVIEGVSMSDVITIRGVAAQGVRLPRPFDEYLRRDDSTAIAPVTVTLRPQEQIAYVHFPVPRDQGSHYDLLWSIIRNPQSLVDALNDSSRAGDTVYDVLTDGVMKEGVDDVHVCFDPLESGGLANLRVIVEPEGSVQPPPEHPQIGSTGHMVICAKVAATITSEKKVGGTTEYTSRADTIMWVPYYLP